MLCLAEIISLPNRNDLLSIRKIWEQTKRFGFISILNLDIKTFVLSFRDRSHVDQLIHLLFYRGGYDMGKDLCVATGRVNVL